MPYKLVANPYIQQTDFVVVRGLNCRREKLAAEEYPNMDEAKDQLDEKLSIREGEAQQPWRRTERIFSHEGKWFVNTREGIELGPYKTRFDAEFENSVLVSRVAGVERARALAVVRAHSYEGTTSNNLSLRGFIDYASDLEQMDQEEMRMLSEFLKQRVTA